MSQSSDTATRVMMVMTGVMALAVLLVAYIAFFPPPPPAPASATPAAGSPAPSASAEVGRPCDPRSFDLEQCPTGQICIAGRCEIDAPIQLCQEGDACDACECAGDLVCYLHRCRREPPAAHEVCLLPAVYEAMTYLARECNRSFAADDQIPSNISCSADDWKKLAIDADKFDSILAAFPARFSIHFESGYPRGGLPAEMRAHYLAEISRHRKALMESKQVLIIGRSSPDGDPTKNYELALRRIDIVTGLIREAMSEPGGGPSLNAAPLRAWSLSGESPLTPARFRSHYSRAPIAWSVAANEQLRRLAGDLDPRSASDWKWLYGAINRVVLVIPIPCDGTEWSPEALASFQGDPPPEGP